MSRQERQSFLAEAHVGVMSVQREGCGPLTVPIWYAYEPGGQVRMVTGGASKKAVLVRKAGRVSLCVQTETAPYKYVSVEGPVTLDTPDFERDIRQVAYRYLGEQVGEIYLQATAEERSQGSNILISLTPERWLSVDYTKMGG